MEYVIGVLALLFVTFVLLGVFVAVRTVRAVKRGVDRTGKQLRRTVEDTALKARAAQPGSGGELARIRLELRSSLDNTRQVLHSGASGDPSLSEALSLLDRLDAHARQLDGELRMLMEREPDRQRVAARLPELRDRAGRIRGSADSLRWAAQDRARQYDQEGLAALDRQIEIEAGALRHWEEQAGYGSAPRPDSAPGRGAVGGAPGPAGAVGGTDGGGGAAGVPRGTDAAASSGTDRPGELPDGRNTADDLLRPETDGGDRMRKQRPQTS